MNTGHTMSAALHAQIVEQLTEAFTELSNTGGDTQKMAEAIGGARYLIASALAKLGTRGPMREIDTALKCFHESLSISTARIGPSAAKESVPTVAPSSNGEHVESPVPVCTGTGASDLDALFAAALISHESL